MGRGLGARAPPPLLALAACWDRRACKRWSESGALDALDSADRVLPPALPSGSYLSCSIHHFSDLLPFPLLATTLSCSPTDLILATVYQEQDALWLADLIPLLVGPFYR